MTARQWPVEHVTKLIVLASTAAALCVAAVLNARGWAAALPLTLGAFLLTSALSAWKAPAAAAIVLLFAYTFPVFVALAPGPYGEAYTGIWIAALFGVVLPKSAAARGWSLPAPWTLPLALWALTVSLVWPFVALRQIDFVPVVIDLDKVGVSVRGLVPQAAILWVVNVALTLSIGILWFEWLFLLRRDWPGALERRIVPALVGSWIVASGVALYQIFVDVTFLNSGTFGFLRRASGTLRDANVFGMVAALCGPAAVLLCRALPAGVRYPVSAAGLLLSWVGVWASGSRTALAASAIAFAFIVNGIREASTRSPHGRRRALVALAVAAAALLVAVRWGPSSIAGPLERMWPSVPAVTRTTAADFAYEMFWRRQAYGTAAVAMIRDQPLFGVGVGAFHLLTADYGVLTGYTNLLPPDNAQNWFRHQLAEFGLLGSLGWIAWVAAFGVFLLRRAPAGAADRSAALTLKGALVGLTAISLVGMPTQHVAVTLTFWTLACWYATLAGPPRLLEQAGPGARSTLKWSLVIGLAAICSLGTWYLARHDLRIPYMARRIGWDYSYGLYGAERDLDGREFRWTMKRAVAVIPAPKPWLKVTVLVNHADLAARPVQARVWRNGVLVLDRQLTQVEPATEYIRVPDGDTRVALDFWCSRAVHPTDFGVNDPRELGLQASWEFVDAPPPGVSDAGGAPRPR